MANLSQYSNDDLMKIAGVPSQPQAKPKTPKRSVDQHSNDELFKLAGMEPTEKNLGLNTMAKKILPTAMTGAEPLPGERTFLGNTFERPAAAVREGIRGGLTDGVKGAVEGYVKGSNFPEQSKTFVQQSQESPVKLLTPRTGNKFGDAVNNVEFFTRGFGRDVGAYIADTVTSPADVLLTWAFPGAGKIKNTKEATKLTSKTVDQSFTKAVRPSVTGRKTAGEVKKAKENARLAIDSIVDNKKELQFIDDAGDMVSGKLPRSLNEFSQAIDKTKRNVFEAYTKLKEVAGQEKRVVFLDDIAKELRSGVDDVAVKDFFPEVNKTAHELADILDKRGFYSLDEANAVVEKLNQSLKAFYRNPDPKMVQTNSLNALVANKLRQKLDTVINDETLDTVSDAGKTFGNLKKRYGALKSIEGDVNKRLVVDARKNTKGLLDYSDIYSAQQLTEGILTHNPVAIMKGTVGYGVKQAIKKTNDPNLTVKNMFLRVDNIKKGIRSKESQLLRSAPLITRSAERMKENVQSRRESVNSLR